MTARAPAADVCLILEGTYPYVSGGVSNWTHELLKVHHHLSFHLMMLVPPGMDLTPLYSIPSNVVGMTVITLHKIPKGSFSNGRANELLMKLEQPLLRLQSGGTLGDVTDLLALLMPHKQRLGRWALLDSPAAWNLLTRMYEATLPESSFLHYFWSWRSLHGALYSVLLAELPVARTYHAVSTGYAGLLAARAHVETGRPALLTEHGIYTNERRVELSMADWLFDHLSRRLDVDKANRDLKDIWMDTFLSYSHACYAACSKIITLYEGNTEFQIRDGAQLERIVIIPNGVEYERYARIKRAPAPHPPTIALIGRVVPIKDTKTFVRTCSILKEIVPDLRVKIIGPAEENRTYFQECRVMVGSLGLQDTITFTGKVPLEEHLGSIDVNVLTSLSEAQPLVILEAGAAGIPTVATDVGACRELILGSSRETPPLGAGGAVTPLGDPTAIAHAIARLLKDQAWYDQCCRTIQRRVQVYYNKRDVDEKYRALYESHCAVPDSCCAFQREH
ncbi:MAG: GT4 family glycosyltransferase PelF [Candidatus Binatia bacterium]